MYSITLASTTEAYLEPSLPSTMELSLRKQLTAKSH